LILIDYLGFGRSDKLEDPAAYAMPLLSADTIVVLDHLNLKQDIIFFGGSMGGRVGYELATNPKHAAYFSSFIINGMRASKNEVILFFKQWAEAGGMENVVTEANKVMAAPFPEEVKQTFLRNPSNIYIAANTHPWPNIKDKLSHIGKPVLLICGENADERADMKEAHQLISNSILKIIPGMDHAQAYWSGEQTVPLMRTFISTL
jgi:pimeloyl-ACP methyl ester carboxylesterase